VQLSGVAPFLFAGALKHCGAGPHTAGSLAFAAVGPEQISLAKGTKSPSADLAGRDSSDLELPGNLGGEVKVDAALPAELFGDFGAHFIAANADARADGGVKITRLRTKVGLHASNRFGADAPGGAAPSAVDGGNGAPHGVNQ